jgi:hypothetical protein
MHVLCVVIAELCEAKRLIKILNLPDVTLHPEDEITPEWGC